MTEESKSLRGSRHIAGILFLILLAPCICRAGSRDSLTVTIHGIGFECHLPQISRDTLHLQPIVMYVDINICNNTDHEVSIGSYWYRFAPEDRKYGRFELVYNKKDTVGLYSNHASLYRLLPNRSIQMHLYYEGNDLFKPDKILKTMAVTWQNDGDTEWMNSDAIKYVQEIIDDLKTEFNPLDEDGIGKIDIRTVISPDIFVHYVDGDHTKAIEMRKNGSSWYGYLKE